MKIAIISTGDELLKGQISDTNGAWIASRIYEMGFDVDRIQVIRDDLAQLTYAVRNTCEQFDLTIVGGGLGPTVDDITARAAADAAGVQLVTHPDAEAQIRDRFDQMNRPMDPVNLKQALLPETCRILPNHHGTAPGFAMSIGGHRAIFLPGPPAELQPMFDEHLTLIVGDLRPHRAVSVFKCFGIGESNMQSAVAPLMRDRPDLRLAFRASFPEIALTVTGPDKNEVSDASREIEQVLKEYIFARELISLPAVLGDLLLRRHMTIGTAESCTGGLIGHSITEIPGSSAVFKGSIVAYDNQVKADLLDVPEELLEQHGAVSEAVVCQMAINAASRLRTDLGLATSGVAGPGGGTVEKPAGTVHIALAHKDGIIHRQCMFTGYNRTRVKTAAAWTAMKLASDHLLETL